MTGTPPDSPAPDPTHWAAEQLGVARSAGPAEARAAFLRHLDADGFVPSPARHQAYRLLSQPTADSALRQQLKGKARLEAEEELRDEVEVFAVRFFGIPVADRQARWSELARACAFSGRLSARLLALRPGLAVEPGRVPNADPVVKALAEETCKLFVLRSAERAVRRQAFIRDRAGDLTRWEEAARQLQHHHPNIAALEPDLVGQLATWTRRIRQVAEMRYRQSQTEQPAPAASGWGSPLRFGWIFIILLIVVLRLLMIAGKPASRSPSTLPPMTFKYDTSRSQENQDKEIEEYLRRFQEREEARKRLYPTPSNKAWPSKPVTTKSRELPGPKPEKTNSP